MSQSLSETACRTDSHLALSAALKTVAEAIEGALDKALPAVKGDEAPLLEAMRYACLGGGKRLRGFLCVEVARLCGAPLGGALRLAASVEMLHAYSLIHDDLPAMDDDDMRRGRPSTHRQFGEAIAILAGDALQTEAFAVIASPQTHADADVRIALVSALACASGKEGMVGGQVVDIRGEGRALPLDGVRRLHAMKTGALIQYAALSGAILAQASAEEMAAIEQYGNAIGTAFQIADDVLDATQSAETLGKTAGKDAASNKSTYVSLLGIEGARLEGQRLTEHAIESLRLFGDKGAVLRKLAHYVVERRN